MQEQLQQVERKSYKIAEEKDDLNLLYLSLDKKPMIPKRNRISKDFFEEINKNGKGLSSPFLSIKYLKNNDNISLFSTVVSKKVSKISPKRNLIKRRINSILNKNKNLIKQGYFVVFYVKPGALDRSFEQIKEETLNLLTKTGFLV